MLSRTRAEHGRSGAILHPPPLILRSHRLAGQGHLPLTEKTGVRIPMRAPLPFPSSSPDQDAALSMREHGFESRREHHPRASIVAHSILLGSRLMAGQRILTPRMWVRALPSQPTHFPLVTLAQSARAPGCELGRCGFEPRTSPHIFRRVVQLAERCPDTAEVNGSTPFTPTTSSMPLHMVATIPVGQRACRNEGSSRSRSCAPSLTASVA